MTGASHSYAVPLECDASVDETYRVLSSASQPLAGQAGVILEDMSFAGGEGYSETVSVTMLSTEGEVIPLQVTVEQVSGSGDVELNYVAADARFTHPNSAGDFRFTIETEDGEPISFGIYASSVTAVSEQFDFDTNPVTEYDAGAAGIALTLPYNGAWHNGNNVDEANPSALGFAPSTSLSFLKNGTTGAVSSWTFGALSRAFEETVSICEKLQELEDADHCVGWDFSSFETRQMSNVMAEQLTLRSNTSANVVLSAAGGNTVESTDLHFLLPDGRRLPAFMRLTHTAGGTCRVTINANGNNSQSLSGRGTVVVGINASDVFGNDFADVQFGVLVGSAGGGEWIQFVAENPVTEYFQGAGGQNITTPFTGIWNNNNNNALSGFAFDPSPTITYNIQGQNNVGSQKVPVLLTVPAYIDETLCTLASTQAKLEAALEAEPVLPQAILPTGLFRIGVDTPANPIDIANTNVVTGFDFTQDGIEDMVLKLRFVDTATNRPWQIQEIAIREMLAQFAAGDTIDSFVLIFDNDFVTVNVVDLVTGELAFADNGREMAYTGAELLSYTEQFVKTGYFSTSSVDVQDINVVGEVTFTEQRSEDGWAIVNNEAQWFGLPDNVVINYQSDCISTTTAQRTAPQIKLEKWDGTAWIEVAAASTGYIRFTSSHLESSHSIFYRDFSPIENPRYRLTSRNESSITGVVNVIQGQFDLEAFSYSMPTPVPVSVVGVPTFPPATGELQVSNFQEGNGGAPFNLQVGNQVNVASNIELLLENKPYSTIPALSLPADTVHEIANNGDGTFNHLFRTLNAQPFANIQITGGVPAPPGDGTAPSLFYQAV